MSKLFITIVALIFVININSQDITGLEKRGRESLKSRDYDAAIGYFTEIIKLTSQLKVSGRTLSNNFIDPEEVALRDTVTIIDPRTAAAYVERGKAFLAKGRFDDAVSDFDHALVIRP